MIAADCGGWILGFVYAVLYVVVFACSCIALKSYARYRRQCPQVRDGDRCQLFDGHARDHHVRDETSRLIVKWANR